MMFDGLPVVPKRAEAPIIAVERWRSVDGSLVKKYVFGRDGDRDRFIQGILRYERTSQHPATVTFDGNEVIVSLTTRNIERVTEIDEEYASFCDALFKDVSYMHR